MFDTQDGALNWSIQLGSEAQEKLALAQYFIRSYTASRQGLALLNILRSGRDLKGDYAEWLVSQLLGLQLASSTVQEGFDASDAAGVKYQIKSREVASVDKSTSFDFRHIDHGFDFLICVFFSPLLDLLGVLKVPYTAVEDHLSANTSSFRFRWNRTTDKDPRIEKLIWPKAESTE